MQHRATIAIYKYNLHYFNAIRKSAPIINNVKIYCFIRTQYKERKKIILPYNIHFKKIHHANKKD